MKDINLITLYAIDLQGKNVPINFRIYDKSENKTKKDYFIDMLNEVLQWGQTSDLLLEIVGTHQLQI